MIQFFGGRLLETVHLGPLWIEAGHHVLNHAVLSGRIHRLDDDQYAIVVLRVKLSLQIPHCQDVLLQTFLGFLFRL